MENGNSWDDDNIDFDSLAKAALRQCEPLYLSEPFAAGGHSSDKPNGTITYIKCSGSVYGVTCAHVWDSQFDPKGNLTRQLTTWGNRHCHHFGSYESDGYRSSFVSLKGKKFAEPFDIAITKLPEAYLEVHMKGKNKIPIDLDNWVEPNWHEIVTALATGYPTEHKEQNEQVVSANLIQLVAERTAQFDPAKGTFLLASSLKENPYFYSGISGGPVYCVDSSGVNPVLIGIVYEGSPGSSKEWDNRGNESFYTKEDVQIKAYYLTPDIFNRWLNQANYL